MTIVETEFQLAPPLYSPYQEEGKNYLYNMLFCDDLDLWRKGDPSPPGSAIDILLSENPSNAELEKIAGNPQEESRYRQLAYNLLRANNAAVPKKILQGVIVETPCKNGLDTLAAFGDGGVRYFNQSGKLVMIDRRPPRNIDEARAKELARLKDKAQEMVRVSQNLVDRTGSWDQSRLPPPKGEVTRITCLVSDGLYFAQGHFDSLANDPLTHPILLAAQQLLIFVVDAVLGPAPPGQAASQNK